MAQDFLAGEHSLVLPLSASTVALANALLAKSGQGVLYGFSGLNTKASAQFILLFDLSSIPANGAVPVSVITVPASSNFGVDFGFHGRPCRGGIVLANSSTSATLTLGSADCWFDVQYL